MADLPAPQPRYLAHLTRAGWDRSSKRSFGRPLAEKAARFLQRAGCEPE